MQLKLNKPKKHNNICSNTGKRTFANEQIAKSELAFCKMAKLHGNETYNQIRYYKCNFCHKFHLTSQEDKVIDIDNKVEK